MTTPEEEWRRQVIDLCWIATAVGFDEDGTVKTYAIPAGRMHRFVAAAQSAGIPAHFRNCDVPGPLAPDTAGESGP